MELDLRKTMSDSPAPLLPIFFNIDKSESQVIGEYINFGDEEQTMCCSSNERCEEHQIQLNQAQTLALEQHTKKVADLYTQMVMHIQQCHNSFCNFIYLCPRLEEMLGKPLEMDLPQIGYFNLNGHGEQVTFPTLCEQGRRLNRDMKDEFIDFILL